MTILRQSELDASAARMRDLCIERRIAELQQTIGPFWRCQKPTGCRGKRAVNVVCIETGKLYSSITEAAEAHGVTPAPMRKAVINGVSCAGYHFRGLP